MTPRQFAAWQRGKVNGEQIAWERARYTAYLSMLPHVSGKRRLKITDLGRFPWEKVQAPVFEEQTEAEKRNFAALTAKFLKMQHGDNSGT